MQALLVGNLVFHLLGIGFDVYGYVTELMSLQGLIAGVVPHALLAAGFAYCLWKPQATL